MGDSGLVDCRVGAGCGASLMGHLASGITPNTTDQEEALCLGGRGPTPVGLGWRPGGLEPVTQGCPHASLAQGAWWAWALQCVAGRAQGKGTEYTAPGYTEREAGVPQELMSHIQPHPDGQFLKKEWISLFDWVVCSRELRQGIPWWSSGCSSALPLQGGTGLIPGWGPKIPHAAQCGQKKKKKRTQTLWVWVSAKLGTHSGNSWG